MNELSRLERALERNLDEMGVAILERRALVGMEAAKSAHGMDFFRLAYNAMFNDMVARAIKVLDRNSQSSSFWYIYRCEQTIVDKFVKENGYDLQKYSDMADRLKHLRDKTHFHIDRDAVFRSKEVWTQAKITGAELKSVIDEVWNILHHVYYQKFGTDFAILPYEGNDATEVILAAQEAGIIANPNDT